MSYKLLLKEPIYALNEEAAESWFVNSYEAADQDKGLDLEQVDARYERLFKVKLLTEKRAVQVSAFEHYYDYVIGVEFPSEAEAVLFKLRWS